MKEIKSEKDFNDIITQDKPIILDFYADWCGPCRMLLPILDKLSTKFGDEVEIAKINVDANPELSAFFKVRSIPALFFIQDGKVVDDMLGVQTQATLEAKIQELQKPVTV